jgi:hypothetical protein
MGASLNPEVNPSATPKLASGDLDMLFHAAQARMALTVGDDFAAACVLQGHEPNARIRSAVLECLKDMNQLHSMVDHEIGQRPRLEAQLHDLQAVLAGVQAALSDAKAEEFEARRRSRHDGLTNLANAELFRERLDVALMQVGAPPLRRGDGPCGWHDVRQIAAQRRCGDVPGQAAQVGHRVR